MRQRAANFAAGNLAFERAIHPSIDHTVKPPATDASFTWIVPPANGFFRGRVYSDGSRLDGPTPLLARNGWAFVVVDSGGETIASASGAPPDWIEDIPATEAWALTQAGMRAEPGCQFFVDCEPCVDAFHAGPARVGADNKPLARIHRLMHSVMDDVPVETVIWMSSHVGFGKCAKPPAAMDSSSPGVSSRQVEAIPLENTLAYMVTTGCTSRDEANTNLRASGGSVGRAAALWHADTQTQAPVQHDARTLGAVIDALVGRSGGGGGGGAAERELTLEDLSLIHI